MATQSVWIETSLLNCLAMFWRIVYHTSGNTVLVWWKLPIYVEKNSDESRTNLFNMASGCV